MKVRIKQATKQGYIECELGGGCLTSHILIAKTEEEEFKETE